MQIGSQVEIGYHILWKVHRSFSISCMQLKFCTRAVSNTFAILKAVSLQLSHVQMNVETARSVNSVMNRHCGDVFERYNFGSMCKPVRHGILQQLLDVKEVNRCERLPVGMIPGERSQVT